jgi:hypothetical protein
MKLVTLGLSLVLIASCQSSDESNTKSFERSYDAERGMQPGVGYKGVLEDTAGVCIDYDGVIDSEAGQDVLYKMRLIENHNDMAMALNLSSASQVKAIVPDTNVQVGVKSKFAFGHSKTLNRFSVNIMLDILVANETVHMKDIKLKEDIQKKLIEGLNGDNPKQALEDFRLRCGDSFMSGYTTGGEYYGMIQVETENEEQKTKIENEITTSVGMIGIGDAEKTQKIALTLQRISSEHKVNIWTHQIGGTGDQAAPATNVQEMLARLKQMTTSVANGANPKKVKGTFSEYFTIGVDLPAEYRNQLKKANRFVGQLAKKQGELLDNLSNIKFVQSHPNSFVEVNAAVLILLDSQIKSTNTDLQRIYDLSYECDNDLNKCDMPADFIVEAVKLPARKLTIEVLERDHILVKTKTHSFNTDAHYDHWLNAPECYIKLEIGANGAGRVTLRRSITVYNNACRSMDYSWEIPIAIIEGTMKSMNKTLDDAWIAISIMEDDKYEDDIIATKHVWFKALNDDGAKKVSVSGNEVSMTASFEAR